MKKALIIIDFQNDFVNGSLGFIKAIELEEKLYNRTQEAINNQEDLYFTLDTHEIDYLESYEGKNLPVIHCVRGTLGHQLYGRIGEFKENAIKIFEKPTFPSLDLANYLKEHPYDQVELCGLVSNICVLSNAIMVKSALPNAKIVVSKNLTASYDQELEDKTFDVLSGLQIEVIS